MESHKWCRITRKCLTNLCPPSWSTHFYLVQSGKGYDARMGTIKPQISSAYDSLYRIHSIYFTLHYWKYLVYNFRLSKGTNSKTVQCWIYDIYYPLPAPWSKKIIKRTLIFFQFVHQNLSAALESFIIVCGTNGSSDVDVYSSVCVTICCSFTALFHLSAVFLLFSLLFRSCWVENWPFLRQ